MILNTLTTTLLAVCFFAVSVGASTLPTQAEPLGPIQRPFLKQGPCDIGIVFNVSSILLDLESYQAGIGAKIGWGDMAVRGLLDLVVNGSSGSISSQIGAAYQYYLIPGSIRPYVGASLAFGFMHQRDAFSAGTLSIGPVAGVELFILDFISVFAEYAISVDLTLSRDLQTSQMTFDYLIDAGMGNDSRIGIVIYFMRAAKKT